MKITAQLEFDTFGEAAEVFRHLGMLGGAAESTVRGMSAELAKAREVVVDGKVVKSATQQPANGAAPAQAAETKPTEVKPVEQPSDAPSLEDLKDAQKAFLAKGGWHTALHGRNIFLHHGLANAKPSDVPPEKRAALIRALETAGPEHPHGEAA